MELLHADLRACLKDNGFESLFPVQSTLIPEVLASVRAYSPSDICICSPTGSGKTLAYVLPIVQSLRACTTRQVRCLVVVPTQDLGIQVKGVFDTFTQGTPLKVALVSGSVSPAQERQELVRSYVDPKGETRHCPLVDIVICTPGVSASLPGCSGRGVLGVS